MFDKLTALQQKEVLKYLPRAKELANRYFPGEGGEDLLDELESEAEFALVLAVYYWSPSSEMSLKDFVDINVKHSLRWFLSHG